MRYPYLFSAQSTPARSALSLALLGAMPLPTAGWAVETVGRPDEVEFDLQVLQTHGVDPKLADAFRQAPRFMPGETRVALTVNGSARGKVMVHFGSEGELCVDAAFLRGAGLTAPPGFNDKLTCFDLKTAWSQTIIHLDPGEERVDLVVPPQAVATPGTDSGNWHHGGFAGMLNYDAQYMGSMGQGAGVNFTQLGSEAGFNLYDWIVRSRQTFSRFNGENQTRHQAAYAQRSFVGIKKVLQAGQISLSNSMFGTGQVLGLQLLPETALQGNRGGAGLVEGIADSQSVVEVRQSGVLVYSTIVPAGPFRLQGFSLLNVRSDLAVSITGSNGETRQFIVPASAFLLNGTANAPGLSFGAGKLDQRGSSESPLLGTLANSWVLTPQTTLQAGLLGATPYRAAALGADSQLSDTTLLSLQITAAQDNRHGNQGLSASASLNHSLSERVGVNLNAVQQTSGYRELSDALQNDQQEMGGHSRNQMGGGISWAAEHLGNLSLSWARSSTFDGDSTDYLRAGWSKQFGTIFVGASLEHSTANQTRDAENRAYLNLSMPLGKGRNVSGYFNNTSNGSRAGVRYSDRSSQDRGWSLSSERDFRYQRTSATASIDRVTPISQFSGSVSKNSDSVTIWSARASGAVVAHDKGVALTPYTVRDTFGIAKVGEEGGVRLETPAGPTWTGRRGYAVVPSLNSYKRSTVQVDTRSLAKNVDIGNAWQEAEAARGSVSYLDFSVMRTRRVLVDVKDAQEKPLPHGAGVFDAAGNFMTVVGEQGRVFIPDAIPASQMEVQTSGITLCSFTLSLPEKGDKSGLYETANAVCR